MAYPVAVAVTAAGHGIAVEPALRAVLHAVAANLISAGVRLVPLGQSDGQRVLDDIGSATVRADLASLRHETQYTRLFRS